MISLRDYYGGSEGGFGPAGSFQANDIQMLSKALTAGYGADPSTQTGGGALRVESLEKTLHVLTYKSDMAKLWKAIPKLPAFNTVEEYNRLEAYGSNANGFVPEGELPATEDSTYTRQTALIKYLGTTRSVTLQMLMVRSAHGDVVTLETMAGTNWLLGILERALFFGDAATVPSEFSGADVQIRGGTTGTANVIDLRGAPLTEGWLMQGLQEIADNYGQGNTLYLANRDQRTLSHSLLPKERMPIPVSAGGEITGGFAFTGFNSEFGKISIVPDTFIRPGGVPPSSATSSSAPSAPTIALAAAGSGSQLAAGTYRYIVTAINRYGESVGSTAATVTPTAGQNVTVTITPGATAGDGYVIYRSPAGGASGTEKYLFKTPSSALTPVDNGFWIEGTSKAFLFQQDLENMSFKQLAPFMKVPLATISQSVRWMMLLFGTPVWYSPGKNRIFINIGTSGISNA